MTRARLATLGAIGLALACGVITIPDVPFAPSNTCGGNADCDTAYPDASATCTTGSCVSGNAFRPVLVVTVPTTTTVIGGRTFALPDTNLLQQPLAPSGCGNIPDGRTCVFLPPLATVTDGILLVSNALGHGLWPPGGLRPNLVDSNPTTLPTRTIFHPMWIDPVTGVPILAAKLGLPLLDITATQIQDLGTGNPPLLAPTNGNTAVPGFVFAASLPQAITPQDPSAFYGMEIIPSDPFAIFPPFVRPLDPRPTTDAGADPTFLNGLGVAPSKPSLTPTNVNLVGLIPTYGQTPEPQAVYPIAVEVDEDVGARSLEGWGMYIVDLDGRRVSGRIALPAGTPKMLTLYEAPNAVQAKQTLIIEPPPTLDMPSLTVPGGVFGGAHIYHALPAPPMVAGSVYRADNPATNVSAHVTFFADGIAATLVHADASPATELNYQKIVTADATLGYETALPPGALRAYIVPDDPDLALTVFDNFQVSITGATQTGKSLPANLRTHVKGHVVLADGTPLYAAEVVVSASTDLPFATNDDPLTHPRDARAFTDVNGNFDVACNPGQVDVSIRPQDGTRYPWVVLTNRAVLANSGNDAGASVTVTLPEVTIPLPTAFPPSMGVLTDSLGNPVPNAIVSAYAFPPAATTPDGGTPVSRGARLIGQTLSDASGNFQLFVAPPDSE